MNELNNVMENSEVKELNEQSNQLSETILVLKVVTAAQYENAGEKLKEVKGIQKRLESQRKLFTQPLDQAKSAIMDFFRKPEEKLKQAESTLKRAMDGYYQEQERIAREAQARLDEQARKEREKLEAQAKRAAESGKTEKADILLTKAAMVDAPVVVAQQTSVSGQSVRKDWDFTIEDASLIPREYLMPDESKIRKMVKAFKEDAKIPGVKAFSKNIISSRSN